MAQVEVGLREKVRSAVPIVEEINSYLSSEYRPDLPLGEALSMGRTALQCATEGEPDVGPENLEVCVLERARVGRKFRRLHADVVSELLGT